MKSNMENQDFDIILFYKYVKIEDTEQLRMDQVMLCTNLKLKGRCIIAEEGINFTLEGTPENITEYIETMKKDERFADVDFKRSKGTGRAFPRLSIKIRDEIVTTLLGDEDVDPRTETSKHLDPEEFHKIITSGEEYYIVDMRNDYEQDVGMFRGSVRSGMRNFRDLKKTAEELKHLKDKKVITVCTGGVRCEKASGYLLKKGYKDVSQLKGGIVRYLEAYKGENFDGRLYVFDGRITMEPFSDKHVVIGRCAKCDIHTEHFADCMSKTCGEHFLCCSRCRDEEGNATCLKCDKVAVA